MDRQDVFVMIVFLVVFIAIICVIFGTGKTDAAKAVSYDIEWETIAHRTQRLCDPETNVCCYIRYGDDLSCVHVSQ